MENAMVKGQDETIKIASFEIGAYRQNEITWKVQEDAIHVVGKRSSALNRSTEALRVEGARFSRVIPIPEQVCRNSISARFVGDGLFIVEGTKKTEKVKRQPSQTAYFDDMGFCVSMQINGKPADYLGGSDNKYVTDCSGNCLERSASGSSFSSKLPSFDSFEEDAELFFRDDPLTDILQERRNSPLLGKE